jgi:hypothetical protein
MSTVVDRASLEGRLQALAAAGLGEHGGRTFRSRSRAGLLRAILSELDSVVMPRTLRLEASGQVLPIEAASLRVLSYGTDAEVDLRGVDPGDETASEAFKTRLMEFLNSADVVKIAYLPMERDFDPTETGVSVATLAEGWGISLSGNGEVGEFLDTFMALSEELVLGWLIQEGEVVETVGDVDITDGLGELHASDRCTELLDAAGDEGTPWRFTAATDDAEGAAATVVASRGDTRVLMAVAPGNLGKIADMWRQALVS